MKGVSRQVSAERSNDPSLEAVSLYIGDQLLHDDDLTPLTSRFPFFLSSPVPPRPERDAVAVVLAVASDAQRATGQALLDSVLKAAAAVAASAAGPSAAAALAVTMETEVIVSGLGRSVSVSLYYC